MKDKHKWKMQTTVGLLVFVFFLLLCSISRQFELPLSQKGLKAKTLISSRVFGKHLRCLCMCVLMFVCLVSRKHLSDPSGLEFSHNKVSQCF